MDQLQQLRKFQADLDILIERYRKEFDLTYAAVIGALFIKANELSQETSDQDEADSDEED